MKPLSLPLRTLCTLSYIFFCTGSYAAESDETSRLLEVFVDYTAPHTSEKPAPQPRTIKDVLGHMVVKNQELTASNLQITTLRGLYTYQQKLALNTLTTIKVNGNQLENVDLWVILGQVHNLTFLDASDNAITKLDGVQHHANLQKLFLHNNQIQRLHARNFFSRLAGLKHVSFHNNQLTSHTITHVDGTAPTIEELYFDAHAVNDKLTQQFIIMCPRLQAEIAPNSTAVQKYYSKMEPRYDLQSSGIIKYLGIGLIAGGFGTLFATVIAMHTSHEEHMNPTKENLCFENSLDECIGKYCSFIVPICALATPLCTRIGERIYGWCTTDPQNRYQLVLTRNIAAMPHMLTPVLPDVEHTPAQEYDETEEAPGQEESN